MKTFTFTELETLLLQLLANAEKHDVFIYSIIHTQFLTGLRINEVLEYNRWSVSVDISNIFGDSGFFKPNFFEIQSLDYIKFNNYETYTVKTEKKSNDRSFNYDELNNIFADCLKNNTTYILPQNYRYISRAFRKLLPITNIYIGNKPVNTHIFRHYKAKQLKNKGYTDEQIKDYLGEKDLKNAQTYINSEIYTI
jgi:integrase